MILSPVSYLEQSISYRRIKDFNEIELIEMSQVNKEDHYICSQYFTWPRLRVIQTKNSLGLYIYGIVHFSLSFTLTIPHIYHGDQHRPQRHNRV